MSKKMKRKKEGASAQGKTVASNVSTLQKYKALVFGNERAPLEKITRYLMILTWIYIAIGAIGIFLIYYGVTVSGTSLETTLQNPLYIPILLNATISFPLGYFTMMVRAHLKEDNQLYAQDRALLYGMLILAILMQNYAALILIFLTLRLLRRHHLVRSEEYVHMDTRPAIFPLTTYKGIYIFITLFIFLSFFLSILMDYIIIALRIAS